MKISVFGFVALLLTVVTLKARLRGDQQPIAVDLAVSEASDVEGSEEEALPPSVNDIRTQNEVTSLWPGVPQLSAPGGAQRGAPRALSPAAPAASRRRVRPFGGTARLHSWRISMSSFFLSRGGRALVSSSSS